MQRSSSFYKSLLYASRGNPPIGLDSSLLDSAAMLWGELQKQTSSEEIEKLSDLAFCEQILRCATTVADLRASVLDNLKLLISTGAPLDSSLDLKSLAILPEPHLFKVMLLVIFFSSHSLERENKVSQAQMAKNLLELFTDRFTTPVSVPIDENLESELIQRLPASIWQRLADCSTEAAERKALAYKYYSTAGDWKNLLPHELNSESAEALVARFDVKVLGSILSEFSTTVFGDSAVTQIFSALGREGRFDDCDTLIANLPENRLQDDLWLVLVQSAANQDEPQRAATYSRNIRSRVLSASADAILIFQEARQGRGTASHGNQLGRLLLVIRATEAACQTQQDSESSLGQASRAQFFTLRRLVSAAQFELVTCFVEQRDLTNALRIVESIEPARKRYDGFYYLCEGLEISSDTLLEVSFLDRLAALALQFRGGEYFNKGVDIFLGSLARTQIPHHFKYAIDLANSLDRPAVELDGTSRLLDLFHENRVIAEAGTQNWGAVHCLLEMIRNSKRRHQTACDAAVLAMGSGDWKTAEELLARAGEDGLLLQDLRRTLLDIESLGGAATGVLRDNFLSAVKKASSYVLTDKPGLAVMAVIQRLMCHELIDGRLDVLNAALDVFAQTAWSRNGARQISEFEALIQPFLIYWEADEIASRIDVIRKDGGSVCSPSNPLDISPKESSLTPVERWERTSQLLGDLRPSMDQILGRWIDAFCFYAVRNPDAFHVLPQLLESASLIEDKATKASALSSIDSAREKTLSAPAGGLLLETGELKPSPLDLSSAGVSSFEAAFQTAASAEFGWSRVLATIKLAQQYMSHCNLAHRNASAQLAVQSLTDFLAQISSRGESRGATMDSVSSLAELIACALDQTLAENMLESLLQSIHVFSSETSDLAAVEIGVAFAKIGASKRAFDVVEQIGSARERCECLGRIAAELGSLKDHSCYERAFARFEEEALELVARFPPVHAVGLALCNVMSHFAEKGMRNEVQSTIGFLMRYMATEGESGFTEICVATIVSSLDTIGAASELENIMKELLAAGLINSKNLDKAFDRIVYGWNPLTHAETVITLVRCVDFSMQGGNAFSQGAMIQKTALLFLKKFPENPNGIRLIAELARNEEGFDFLCQRQFWRHFEELPPDARRTIIRRLAILCPFREDVARWILTEIVALNLFEGKEDEARDIAHLTCEIIPFLEDRHSMTGTFGQR
jgi:hypothetical protein